MTEDLLGLDFTEAELAPPAGNAARFGGRWRLVSAGLSDVWRYGDLELPAASGRLLMRGPTGTGKTTALEVLWPYVLDLNAAKLGAGKARFTSLKLLMSEGARTKRRYGYVWLTFAAPHPSPAGADASGAGQPDPADTDLVTYGVRLQYSEGASPAVKPIGFTVPGQPLRTLPLHGEHRTALELEQFTELVTAAGGHVFTDDDDGYVDDLARRIWSSTASELRQLAGRLREVRNPSLLGDVSPRGAAEALRASLPGVDTDVLTATADALDASNTTREAFARDSQAATVLADFEHVWAGHATDIVRTAHTAAVEAATISGQYKRDQLKLNGQLAAQTKAHDQADSHVQWLEQQIRRASDARGALEKSDAYQASGRLADLEKTGRAERDRANGDFQQLLAAATDAAKTTARDRRNLDQLGEDLSDTCAQASGQGAEPVAVPALLSVSTRPRSTHTVAARNADPGPGLTVTADTDALDAVAGSWRELAERARTQSAAAALAITDHRTVADAASAAGIKRAEAERAAAAYDSQEGVLRRSTHAADAARHALLDQAAAWAPQHPDLRGLAERADDVDPDAADDTARAFEAGSAGDLTWDLDDVTGLREQEPASVLAAATEWASLAVRTAERHAATAEQAATRHVKAAAQARTDATALEQQAARLRAGELLALPRPQWLPAGDDSRCLGSALEWADTTTGDARDLLEAALADSGLLAAELDPAGAHTSAWHVSTEGPPAAQNLTAVLRCAPDHPHAEHVTAILGRIGLAPNAHAPHDETEPRALVIGQDGTWRAGPLHADSARAATDRNQPMPAAAHIGARQRHEAALREATRLEAQAGQLRTDAAVDDHTAKELRTQARATRAAALTFPSLRTLTDAENRRVTDAQHATVLDQARERTAADSEAAAHAHTVELDGWTARTRARDLPTDLDQLNELARTGKQRHQRLVELATTLTKRHLPRLRELLHDLTDEAHLASALSRRTGAAVASDTAASKTEREVSQLRSNVGQSMQDALDAHARLTEELGEAEEEMPAARQQLAQASSRVVETSTLLETAERNLQQAQPALTSTVHRLRQLLHVAAVAEVLIAGIGLDDDDEALLEQLDGVLAGRRTTARHHVGQRYDTARAELARTWSLTRADAGNGLNELDLYVLAHDEHEYTPAAAATKAEQLARRAQEQLAAAEQSALTDFVIGMLPAAIGTAWVDLRDWRHGVNRKMKAAAASSGVGVQVETPLRDDLDDATRTVYRLCCQTSNADRTAQDKVDVGQALQALLAAAEGDTMLERLTKAVDISEWVDVHYLVTRPGKTATRWNQRTGLSGGERRLVVLAPMLAAIAANYDRLGPTGLRLAALDEVPAEVDERGREGLARYIAELDLDLLCTSYLWDGAPGAWDGIDAHDLEAGPDGTVVAFPMLVRGLLALPGDGDGAPGLRL